MGFPGGSDSKGPACNEGDPSSIPGLGRVPGEGNGYPLQYSWLENSMDSGAWQACTWGPRELDTTEQLTLSISSTGHLNWNSEKKKFKVTLNPKCGGLWMPEKGYWFFFPSVNNEGPLNEMFVQWPSLKWIKSSEWPCVNLWIPDSHFNSFSKGFTFNNIFQNEFQNESLPRFIDNNYESPISWSKNILNSA